MSLPASS